MLLSINVRPCVDAAYRGRVALLRPIKAGQPLQERNRDVVGGYRVFKPHLICGSVNFDAAIPYSVCRDFAWLRHSASSSPSTQVHLRSGLWPTQIYRPGEDIFSAIFDVLFLSRGLCRTEGFCRIPRQSIRNITGLTTTAIRSRMHHQPYRSVRSIRKQPWRSWISSSG